jgi:glycosyltransferase involved in cell wall biosynthesis
MTSQFLAIGGAVAADAIRLGIATPDRVRVIASAVEAGVTPATPESRRAARRALGIPAGMKVVGTVGRLDFQKAPLDMVSAIAKMQRRDVFGIWIGNGPLLEKAKRAAREAGLAQRFIFLGQRDDVAALLPAFDVFAMSSLYEGVPCALVEGMLCGIPAVATAVNGVPDVVVHGRTGLLARPGDPSSIARALDHLLEDPRRAETMAAAARALVQDEFRPRHLGEALKKTYSDVLDVAPPQVRAQVTEIHPPESHLTASLAPAHVSRRES